MKFQLLLAIFILANFSALQGVDIKLFECTHEIYCQGEIPNTIQQQIRQFKYDDDSKCFVDRPLKLSVAKIKENFAQYKLGPQNLENLKLFLDTNFYKNFEEVETLEIPAEKWIDNPAFLNEIKDDKLKQMSKSVHQQWKNLYRQFKAQLQDQQCTQTSLNDACFSSLKTQNQKPFIIAGERFSEFYYWDSYWIIKGLLTSDLSQIAKDMIDNFADLLKEYGVIYNGARIYFSSRSQPPLFIQMCQEYYNYLIKKAKDEEAKQFLQGYYDIMEIEYKYWEQKRGVTITVGTTNYVLHQYNSVQESPRPEALIEDLKLSEGLSIDDKKKLFKQLGAAAESGLDFSSRWLKDPYTLSSIETSNVLPVDLNSILYKNEKSMEQFSGILEKTDNKQKYQTAAANRMDAMNKIFKNINETWNDFDVSTKQLRSTFYASNYVPIWAFEDQISDKSWENLMKDVDLLITYPGGIPTSKIESGQQWDYPNVWAPGVSFLVEGLYNVANKNAALNQKYSLKDRALKLAEKWISNVYCAYNLNNKLYEKYNAQIIGQPGSGGEYKVQTGFGWTNGLFLQLISTIGKDLDYSQKKCMIEISDYEYPKPSQGDDTIIALIGTNDLHGQVTPLEYKIPGTEESYSVGGLINMATAIRQIQKDFPNQYLWLDAGDQWTGTLINYITKGKVISEFFNGFGTFKKVDGVTTGNHDFDFGLQSYIETIKKYDIQYIAANIYNKQTQKFVDWDKTKFVQGAIYKFNEIKIGVIGLATVSTPLTSAANFSTLEFKAYKDLTIQIAKQMREEKAVNAVILLAHVGISCQKGDAASVLESNEPKIRDTAYAGTTCDEETELYQFLKDLPDGVLDGVIAGHQHEIVHHWVNKIPIMIAKSNAKNINIMYLKFDKNKKLKKEEMRIEGPIPICDKVFSIYKRCDILPSKLDLTKMGQLIPYSFHKQKMQNDEEYCSVIKPYMEETNNKGRKKIAYVANDMVNSWDKESQLGNIFCDAMKESRANIDVTIANNGMVRVNWPKGDINYNLLFNTIPFDNKFSIIDMTGEELIKTIFTLQEGVESFYQVSGLQMKLIKSEQIENRKGRQLIALKLYNGNEIELAKTYKVGMPDFMLNGGVDFSAVLKFYTPRNRNDYELIREILETYVTKKQNINTNESPAIDPNHPRLSIHNCEINQYFSYETNECINCENSCQKCILNNKNQYCFLCSSDKFQLKDGKCIEKCKPNQYLDSTNLCKSCPEHCLGCALKEKLIECSACEAKYELTEKKRCEKYSHILKNLFLGFILIALALIY